MKIPFKPSRLSMRRRPVKYLIIHHTAELYPQEAARIDNSKYQINSLFNGVLEDKSPDINYHFVLDKIKDDYVAVTCRPFVTLCEWNDISDDINNAALHIALLGSYDFKVPEKRAYEVLAYRIVNPLLKMFGLPQSDTRILLHSEVSSDEDLSCPGEFFDKAILISMVKRFVMR